MKYFLWAALLALAGCTHTAVQVGSGGTVTTTTGLSVSISGQASPAWALIGIGAIAWGSAHPASPPPPLDASRRVNEVDCTKPIQDWSANLKCR